MRILVVEDTVMMAKTFIDMLQSAGHQVDWVIGFERVKRVRNPICTAPDGSKLVVDASQYDLVLMDGDLKGKITGDCGVPAFTSKGAVCFGTSTMSEMNDEMIKAGAVHAATKVTIYFALYHGRVKAEDLVACSFETRARLSAAQTECKNNRELRKAAEQFLLEHVPTEK
ncbi:MAG: hypothetical protein K8F91_16145 [Candidatus Obscuribacterales bacterium]|nr:hypothetical protein [Candidatus Obscuribacterales bacterium]